MDEHPYHLSVSGDGRRFVVVTSSGKCRVFDSSLTLLDEIDVGARPRWVQLGENGSRLIVGHDSHVDAYSMLGNIALSATLPIHETGHLDCVLMDDQRVLCAASFTAHNGPMISAWGIESSRLIAEVPPLRVLRDTAGYSLVAHPEGEAIAVVAYSGQSEESMFWAHYAHGRLRVFERPVIEDVAHPCFHPTGSEFVSYHERLGLCSMKFPSGEVIASVQREIAFPHNPDDGFSYEAHFVRDDRFLLWQENLALYEFDLATLLPIRAVLTGADGLIFGEDRFFSGSSRMLAGSRLLTSDFKIDRAPRRETTLRLWDASSLVGPMSSPDSTRPFTRQLLSS